MSFRAYQRMTQVIEDTFSPKIVVVASENARQLCHMNYLTPAEFFTPFACNLNFKADTRIEAPREFDGEICPTFQVQYRKLELIDIEEWQPMTEEYLETNFKDVLDKNKPKVQDLMKITHDDVLLRPRSMLNVYGWDEACNLTSEYLKTIAKEYEWVNFNECQAIMYVLSSEEQKELDVAIMDLDKKNLEVLTRILGENPALDPKKQIIRLIAVLRPKDSKQDTEAVRNRIDKSLKRRYPDALIQTILVNDAGDSSKRDVNFWRDELFAIKRKIKFYDLGGEKVKSDTPDLPRGEKMEGSGLDLLKGPLIQLFSKQLPEKFKQQLTKQWQTVVSKKKTVKKGFMGLSMFKKEEKANFHLDGEHKGKYLFTEVEKEVKRYGDMLLLFGMTELAKEEFAFVVENLGKKSNETTNSIGEMVMYLSLAIPSREKIGFPKEKMKNINKTILEHLLKAQNYPFRYARLQFVTNLLNHVYYDGNEVPPLEAQRAILQGHYKFSIKHNQVMLDFLCPFLLQQYSRYLLLNRPRNVRTFYASTVESSANYLKRTDPKTTDPKLAQVKRTDLKSYALAGYIICSKFYGLPELKSWGLLNELVFYNLAVLDKDVLKDDKLELQGFISTLNNMQETRNKTSSEFVKKADHALKVKLKRAMKQSQVDASQDFTTSLSADPLTATNTTQNQTSITDSQPSMESILTSSNYPELERTATENLKMLEMKGFALITPNEFSEKISREEEMDSIPDEVTSPNPFTSSFNQSELFKSQSQGSSLYAGNVSAAVFAPGKTSVLADSSQAIKRHYEVFESILKSKFPQSCQDALKTTINYSKIESFGSKIKSVFRPREIFKGEKVVYQFRVKNKYWTRVQSEFEQIKLVFYHIPDPLPNFYTYKPEHILPSPSQEFFTYQVNPVGIERGETKTLEVEVTFLQSGAFRLKSIEIPFLGLIPFKYEMPNIGGKYDDLKVLPVETGSIGIISKGLRPEIHFGEVLKSSLKIWNKTKVDIEELYLISSEPLYTGFGFKPLDVLRGEEAREIDFFIRGIDPKLNTISLIFVYRSNSAWKYSFFTFDLSVKRSFSTKYHSEDIGEGKRLVCIDVINGKDYNHVKPEDLEVCNLRLNSNTWRIVKESQKLITNDKIVMIYFNVEPRPDLSPETQYLARRHREVT